MDHYHYHHHHSSSISLKKTALKLPELTDWVCSPVLASLFKSGNIQHEDKRGNYNMLRLKGERWAHKERTGFIWLAGEGTIAHLVTTVRKRRISCCPWGNQRVILKTPEREEIAQFAQNQQNLQMLLQRICFCSESVWLQSCTPAFAKKQEKRFSLILSCYCAVFLRWIVALAESFWHKQAHTLPTCFPITHLSHMHFVQRRWAEHLSH